MHLRKKKAAFLKKVIAAWQQENVIDQRTAQKLEGSIQIIKFDWKRLAKWSFRFAIACFIISAAALIASPVFIQMAKALSSLFKFGFGRITLSLIVAGGAYYFAFRAMRIAPKKVFRNESILFLAVAATTWLICELGIKFDTGSGHFSILILLSSIAYAATAYFYKSKMVWVFALISLGAWMGAETGYMSGWNAYYFGMNVPLRFMLFGLVLSATALILKDDKRVNFFFGPTLCLGLLYLFMSSWIMSIFGNYGDMDSWYHVKQIELFHWSLLFGVYAIIAMYIGFKEDVRMLRGFGVTFLCINLYTRFFEYFWNGTHKAIFFFIIGLSFWLLASKAENVWNKLESSFGKIHGED
jgi:hypothetical protein